MWRLPLRMVRLMAPPKKPWFRTYVEMLHDPKLRRLKPELRWVWLACLAGARMSHRPGYLYVAEDLPMDVRDLAELAGVSVKVAVDAVEAFMNMRMLGVENGGQDDQVWFVPKWGDRQFESDDSTPRSRKNRVATAMQRSINGDATHQRQTTESETESEVTRGSTEMTDDLQSAAASSSDQIEATAQRLAEMMWPAEMKRKGIHPSRCVGWVIGTRRNIVNERRYEIMALLTEGMSPERAAAHLHEPPERPALTLIKGPACEECHGVGRLPSDPDSEDPLRRNHAVPCPSCNSLDVAQ